MPEIEPRFGDLLKTIEKLQDYMFTTSERLGRIEANMDNVKETITRVEQSVGNAANRLERKLDVLSDSIDKNKQWVRILFKEQGKHCAGQDKRIEQLEHDKTQVLGASKVLKIIFGVVGVAGVSFVGIVVTWLFKHFNIFQ